ncbi:beta-ketoacyl synthase [Mucilaginibacter rubeus]|uniref:Beta-ketoacyl synthase n=1 Tax=Mucilaginibacter rubeus TaxID=2027860 RepID=A0AAE6JJ44_9SPHI|nr:MULTISPECIES: beta-ketoacyl synthase chain length factor [Mucilaginibacter]QEM06744.1 beta-ketoacyl synthase [Mucilaginibacter rubeus]QEM19332.1 beta-ketoacyl synthase [Mucilaginibacter gossypii]QTE44123.1 beta-ketoacyl synthase chain length factor [Mucilaginibacter rubeus]QTE50724.1 beta-ketoacyl synthase chain length factor [Mucilaginibacter rubeus]QTE55806.1 beta-ketoacyl synthase chain length factor [Mucilaginibacter rubeus]
MYIRAASNISPQNTFGTQPFLSELVEYTGDKLACIEPDYKSLIDPKLIRRMSRIIKMGVAAGMDCLHQAGINAPDAIITGTAYGCMEDTNTFLSKMVQQNEEALSPTAFIQSTHNTISAQIALLLQCHQYNNTFVNGGASFENALLDATMLLYEGEAANILVGGIDEIMANSRAILKRMGLYRQHPASNFELLNTPGKGTMAGEGSAFFMLSREALGNGWAKIDGVSSFYKPRNTAEIKQQISIFLQSQNTNIHEIDLVLTGNNGDLKNDAVYEQLLRYDFANIPAINYKALCGEYPTSSAFATWLAAHQIKNGACSFVSDIDQTPLRKVLIYNHYQNIHHSLILLSAC